MCVRINFNKIQKAMGTRLGFVLTLLILYWLKTLLAYTVDFNLDIQVGKLQGNYLAFIAFFNPLPLGLLLLALALYARSTKIFYSISIAIAFYSFGSIPMSFTIENLVTLSRLIA